MELTVYNIIRRPVVSSKASELMQKQQKVVLEVHPHANKPLVKQALKKLFNVEVETIRIIVRKGKIRMFKRIQTQGKLTKRAIVTLKPGYSLGAGDVGAQMAPEQMPLQQG